MKSITIEIDGVGAVLFERSKRAKHIIITAKPFKGIRVAVPYRVSFKNAKEFVNSKTTWIKKHLAKIKYIEQKHNSILNNSNDIDKAEARRFLINRLSELAGKYGFSYNRVFIRNQKTMWGSCSAKNNINLNIKLVKLPNELIDYVILHELVHIREKNHSKNFWAEFISTKVNNIVQTK